MCKNHLGNQGACRLREGFGQLWGFEEQERERQTGLKVSQCDRNVASCDQAYLISLV